MARHRLLPAPTSVSFMKRIPWGSGRALPEFNGGDTRARSDAWGAKIARTGVGLPAFGFLASQVGPRCCGVSSTYLISY